MNPATRAESAERERDEAREQVRVLTEALREVQGCFQAAYVEGLQERLGAEEDNDTGSLRDLIERRILYAYPAVNDALEKLSQGISKTSALSSREEVRTREDADMAQRLAEHAKRFPDQRPTPPPSPSSGAGADRDEPAAAKIAR